ncbi:mannosyl-3-phosphoglycerate synthase, partial [Apodospora peruviana]
MRLTLPQESEAFRAGGLRIESVVQVIELDAGADTLQEESDNLSLFSSSFSSCSSSLTTTNSRTMAVGYSTLDTYHAQTTIIIPCKNENLEVLEIVLSGIPRLCMIVLVSNSTRSPDTDRYAAELSVLHRFCALAGNRSAMAIHQKDAGAAAAFRAAGMPELVSGSDGRIANGKGEGMLLGIALTAVLCPDRRYVGFVDADNTGAGSVNEYCRAYAAGFATYPHEKNMMVRVNWGSKPKVVKDRLDFKCEGRSSRIINRWLNDVLGRVDETVDGGLMVTGNSGEHAMTMDMAMRLRLAGGYAVEPFHFVDLLERNMTNGGQYRGGGGGGGGGVGAFGLARVLQVRTRNPHIHRSTDDTHIRDMYMAGLGTIYHHLPTGPLPTSVNGNRNGNWGHDLRKEILNFIASETDHEQGQKIVPPKPRIYTPLERLDLVKLRAVLDEFEDTLY